MPFSANSRNAAGTSSDGMSNFGISNFGVSNGAMAEATGFFDFGGVVVLVSAMILILRGHLFGVCEPPPSAIGSLRHWDLSASAPEALVDRPCRYPYHNTAALQ